MEEKVFKIKSGFVLREVAGTYIVVSVGERVKEFNGLIKLNDTGVFIWKLLTEGATESQITESVSAEYDAPKELIEKDVNSLLKKLTEANLLA